MVGEPPLELRLLVLGARASVLVARAALERVARVPDVRARPRASASESRDVGEFARENRVGRERVESRDSEAGAAFRAAGRARRGAVVSVDRARVRERGGDDEETRASSARAG